MTTLIDQGGFGCVFYPGFNCRNKLEKTNEKFVSKLQLNTFNARNEILIGKKVSDINNYKLYFLPVIDSCDLSIANIDKKSIDKCQIIEKGIDKYKVLELLYLENISFDKLFSDSTRSTRNLFLTLIETYKYIAIAIGELIAIDIVHFDIKEQNILYSTKYENPILIDFGLSIPIKTIDNSNLSQYFYVYAPDYYLWPLEVHIINYIIHKGTLTLDAIKTTIDKYIKTNSSFKTFSQKFIDYYIKSSIDFYSKFVKMDSAAIIFELLQYSHTWDLYSLSIMYLKFFNKLFNKGYFDNSFIINFSQILLENLSPYPYKRLTSQDTYKKYQDIFYLTNDPATYKILIQQLEIQNK